MPGLESLCNLLLELTAPLLRIFEEPFAKIAGGVGRAGIILLALTASFFHRAAQHLRDTFFVPPFVSLSLAHQHTMVSVSVSDIRLIFQTADVSSLQTI